MPIKDWLYRLQPVKLYIILAFSCCYLILQLFLSHISHALTLQFSAYHMLCNIIALSGLLISIKQSKKQPQTPESSQINVNLSMNSNENVAEQKTDDNKLMKFSKTIPITKNQRSRYEIKLRNTFGWTRIDVLTMSIVFIFLASLSFSHLIEVVKVLIHIDHKDAAHYPIPILVTGTVGLIINIFCYILIGGYSAHQGCLHSRSRVKKTDDKELNDDVVEVKCAHLLLEEKKNSTDDNSIGKFYNRRQRNALVSFLRDISSTLFVIICATSMYWSNYEDVEKFIDPIISIISLIVLITMSYPYMRESCLILLQTIPGSIDIEIFKRDLLEKFTEVVSIHDLHIWSLSTCNYVSTAHIIFKDPRQYKLIRDEVKNFFCEQGITIVTIQPEFQSTNLLNTDCLLTTSCKNLSCSEKSCCPTDSALQSQIIEIVTGNHQNNDDKISNLNQLRVMSVLSLDSGSMKQQNKYLKNPNYSIKTKFSSESKINSIHNKISTNLNDDNEGRKLSSNDDIEKKQSIYKISDEKL